MSEWTGCAVCHVPRRDHDPATFVEWEDMPTTGPLSEHEIVALRSRYDEKGVPPCRICGAELTIGKMGGGEPTVWQCGSEDADWLSGGEGFTGPKYQHFRDSEYVQRLHGDSSVIRALDELQSRRTSARS